jgi:hypothetical protein
LHLRDDLRLLQTGDGIDQIHMKEISAVSRENLYFTKQFIESS